MRLRGALSEGVAKVLREGEAREVNWLVSCAVETCNCVVNPISLLNWGVFSSLICLCTLAIAFTRCSMITCCCSCACC